MTAATTLVGCPGGDPPPDAELPSTSMCGDNVCLDLNDPRNAALTVVDGTLTFGMGRDQIRVVRTSSTAVHAVSDICTHESCAIQYNRAARVFDCPCHGSRFSLAGAVLRGPATRSLASYVTQLDPTTNVLTIVLS